MPYNYPFALNWTCWAVPYIASLYGCTTTAPNAGAEGKESALHDEDASAPCRIPHPCDPVFDAGGWRAAVRAIEEAFGKADGKRKVSTDETTSVKPVLVPSRDRARSVADTSMNHTRPTAAPSGDRARPLVDPSGHRYFLGGQQIVLATRSYVSSVVDAVDGELQNYLADAYGFGTLPKSTQLGEFARYADSDVNYAPYRKTRAQYPALKGFLNTWRACIASAFRKGTGTAHHGEVTPDLLLNHAVHPPHRHAAIQSSSPAFMNVALRGEAVLTAGQTEVEQTETGQTEAVQELRSSLHDTYLATAAVLHGGVAAQHALGEPIDPAMLAGRRVLAVLFQP